MKNAIKTLATCAAFMGASAAFAQPLGSPPPSNVVHLSASGSAEVTQDWLRMRLSTHREGPDAAAVQADLKAALEVALTVARAQAQKGELDVRTGHFGLTPRYGREGRIDGWQGSAELVLEGRDVTRISTVAGAITTLSVAGVTMDLSPQLRARSESQAQAEAIERFKARAVEVAKGLGLKGFAVRELTVSSDGGARPQPMAMSMQSQGAKAAVPVEPGRGVVSVTVSGSVQLK